MIESAQLPACSTCLCQAVGQRRGTGSACRPTAAESGVRRWTQLDPLASGAYTDSCTEAGHLGRRQADETSHSPVTQSTAAAKREAAGALQQCCIGRSVAVLTLQCLRNQLKPTEGQPAAPGAGSSGSMQVSALRGLPSAAGYCSSSSEYDAAIRGLAGAPELQRRARLLRAP